MNVSSDPTGFIQLLLPFSPANELIKVIPIRLSIINSRDPASRKVSWLGLLILSWHLLCPTLSFLPQPQHWHRGLTFPVDWLPWGQWLGLNISVSPVLSPESDTPERCSANTNVLFTKTAYHLRILIGLRLYSFAHQTFTTCSKTGLNNWTYMI